MKRPETAVARARPLAERRNRNRLSRNETRASGIQPRCPNGKSRRQHGLCRICLAFVAGRFLAAEDGANMSDREAFGPNLRRMRMQRCITIEQIAAATKVSASLWSGLERNDLSRWPTGIYARAYVRAYAVEIGIDPQATVDEFCRSFPTGDRRAGRVVREQAALIGHDLHWKDDLADVDTDRRVEPSEPDLPPIAFTTAGRLIAAVGDACAVVALAVGLAALLPIGWAVAAAVGAFAYQGVSLIALGCTPAVWTVETFLASRHPSKRGVSSPRFIRLLRGSQRA
jgi:transcriptional regulator with XRE-family HTH domain